MVKIEPWTRQISYGHRAMYYGPVAIMKGMRSSVIDVACGDGFGYHTLISNDAVSRYFGIDTNPSEIEKGRKWLINDQHEMVCDNWLTYPEYKIIPADYVFCIEMLEHLEEPERITCVDKCRRFARKNVFISTPPADRNDHGRLTIPECHNGQQCMSVAQGSNHGSICNTSTSINIICFNN